MPFYTYKCKECNKQYTVSHEMTKPLTACPMCNADAQQLIRVPVINQVRLQNAASSTNQDRNLEIRRKNLTSYIESMREELKGKQ